MSRKVFLNPKLLNHSKKAKNQKPLITRNMKRTISIIIKFPKTNEKQTVLKGEGENVQNDKVEGYSRSGREHIKDNRGTSSMQNQ